MEFLTKQEIIDKNFKYDNSEFATIKDYLEYLSGHKCHLACSTDNFKYDETLANNISKTILDSNKNNKKYQQIGDLLIEVFNEYAQLFPTVPKSNFYFPGIVLEETVYGFIPESVLYRLSNIFEAIEQEHLQKVQALEEKYHMEHDCKDDDKVKELCEKLDKFTTKKPAKVAKKESKQNNISVVANTMDEDEMEE